MKSLAFLMSIVVTQLSMGCGYTSLALKDGKTITGSIKSADAAAVQMSPSDGSAIVSIARTEVGSVDYSGSSLNSWGLCMTLGGALLAVVGVGVVVNSGRGYGGFAQAMFGIGGIVVGIPTFVVGIPLWIIGGSRASSERELFNQGNPSVGTFWSSETPSTYSLAFHF